MNCLDCGACCKYVVLPIQGLDDDAIRWLEMHPGLKVVNGRLYISIQCKNLLPDNKCAIYADRPRVCRDFKKGGLECLKSRMLYHISNVEAQAQNETKETDLNAEQ